LPGGVEAPYADFYRPLVGGDCQPARDAGLFVVKIMLIDVYFTVVIEPFKAMKYILLIKKVVVLIG
jgi:hypothetical protein